MWWTVTKLRWEEMQQEDKTNEKKIYTQKSTIQNVESLNQEKGRHIHIYWNAIMKKYIEKCSAGALIK